ncbi:MAG: MarR family transcriptional regulator [Gemmatimonadota bacterium]
MTETGTEDAETTGGRAREADTVAAVDALRRVLRVMRTAATETQATLGISAAQLFVLSQLTGADGLSINELAERTLTDRSSVAAVVDRLVGRGLAERSASPRDRRRAAVRITPAGRSLLEAAPVAPTALLVAGLARLPEPELHTLAVSLGRLVGAMRLEATAAPMFFEEEQP